MLDPDETTRLVAAAAAGDQSAWDRLVAEYAGLVWAVIRGCGLFGPEAADVSQTVWLRFVEHIGGLRQADRAGAWLATTARHECFRVLRKSGRQVVSAEVPEVAAPDDAEEVVDLLMAADDRATVLLALGRIPERCQQLLRLMAAEPPLSYDEIAASMDVPRGWIGPTRGRCLNHLRRAIAALPGPGNGSVPGSGGGGPAAEVRIRRAGSGSGHMKEADR